MKPPAIALTLTAASLLLIAARATERGNVEAGEGGAVFDLAATVAGGGVGVWIAYF